MVTSTETPAPYTAGIAKPTAARPVPNAVAAKSSPSDVADLSEMPGKVDATSEPTSKPISAVVDVANGDQGTGEQRPASCRGCRCGEWR